MYDKYQQKLSQHNTLNLDRESEAIKEFFGEIEKMGYKAKGKKV